MRPVIHWLPKIGRVFGIVAILVALADPVINNFLLYNLPSRTKEVRHNLHWLDVMEEGFYREHERYANFQELNPDWAAGYLPCCGSGFTTSRGEYRGASTRYTYRIDRSGVPGTVIQAVRSPSTPDNTVVPAGLRCDPPGFTITATANLDDDPTLDQWHISDGDINPVHDVNDLMNESKVGSPP